MTIKGAFLSGQRVSYQNFTAMVDRGAWSPIVFFSNNPCCHNFPALDKRKYVLTGRPLRSRMNAMNTEPDPIVGNWYRHLDKGQMFRVIAFDESDATIELQHFDGDIEEVSLVAWRAMDLEVSEAPEDWTGPIDDIERDDLGYSSETAMSDEDWRKPLQEVRGDEHEAWENTAEREETENLEERPSAEELWEPQKIENLGEDSIT